MSIAAGCMAVFGTCASTAIASSFRHAHNNAKPSAKLDTTKMVAYNILSVGAARQAMLLLNNHRPRAAAYCTVLATSKPTINLPDANAPAFATHNNAHIAMGTHAAAPLEAGMATVLNRQVSSKGFQLQY